jgi:hypothetical protein
MATEPIALFIDLENIATSLWKGYQQSPDLFSWLERTRKYGHLAFGRAYGDFSQASLSKLEPDLRALAIDKFDCPVKQNGQSTVDGNVIMDLYEVALDQPRVNTYVLMAGDSDYIRVVAKLRQRMNKKIVVMGVPGSVSRELVRAAGFEEPLEPQVTTMKDYGPLIRLIDQYESSRREGALPVFRFLSQYLGHPRNENVIRPQVIQPVLTELVNQGILVQSKAMTPDGHELTTTQLDRLHPLVTVALQQVDRRLAGGASF